jgi:DNA repair exonuclease SbcCD nuclease subunit
MSEIRLLTSSDEHQADISPGFRKDNYRDSILAKLHWQGQIAAKFSANAVLRGGDLFHVKAANKNTFATTNRIVRIHREYHCPTYSVSGNHDMSNNDPDTLDRQPLGLLFSSNVIRPLRDETFTDGSMRVRVVGVDYKSDLADEGLREMVKKRPGDTYTIAFVHALASMAPEERIQSFFHERVFDYRDLVFDGCPDVYVFGHYHKDQGIVRHLGIQFVNLGAVSRGALTFENVERKPKVGLIKCNSQGIFVEEHVVPHADASEVFDFERKKKLELEFRDMREFVSKFRASADVMDSKSIAERVAAFQRSSEYALDLRNLLREVMENAEAGAVDD